MIGWIGALLGIAASVRREDAEVRAEKLALEVRELIHGREQLRAHIELLERELATQRSMADHWLRQCQTAMRERREIEDERDALRTQIGAPTPRQSYHHEMLAQQMAAQSQALKWLDGQQQYASMQNIAVTPYDILRNCSPGRYHSLLNQLNEQG